MSVLYTESEEPGDSVAAVRISVHTTMANGDLNSIENVEKVTYLGSTMKDITKLPVVAAATITESTETPQDPADQVLVHAVVGVSVAAAFILLLLLFLRSKRENTHTKDEMAGAANGLGMELDEMSHEDGWDGDDDVEFGAVANMDESGSFHLGRYHYRSDGRRYYSKNCSVCAEMIAQYGEEPSQALPTTDVHSCSSSTCLRCNNGVGPAPEVTFIKADGALFATNLLFEPIAEEVEEGTEEEIRM